MSKSKGRGGLSDVHPLHSFKAWQVWPGSYDNPTPEAFPFSQAPRPRIDRSSPLAGIGSCFIREMKIRLLQAGYTFLEEEREDPAARHASAAWERLYSLFSVRQVLEYALLDRVPRPRWWITPQTGMVQDPYRRIVLYDDLEQAEAGFAAHREAARQVLTQARFLLLSLDYTDIWEDRETGAVICLPSGPYFVEGGDLSRYQRRATRMAENLAALHDIQSMLRSANPECRLVLVLSPIQQWATFREDADVFSAGCAAKAILRSAVEEFTADNPDVFYFPAFEMAMLQAVTKERPVFTQGRENFHIHPALCDTIVQEFIRWAGPDG